MENIRDNITKEIISDRIDKVIIRGEQLSKNKLKAVVKAVNQSGQQALSINSKQIEYIVKKTKPQH